MPPGTTEPQPCFSWWEDHGIRSGWELYPKTKPSWMAWQRSLHLPVTQQHQIWCIKCAGMVHGCSKCALGGKGWATNPQEDTVQGLGVFCKQPTKCQADVHTCQQLVWWSLNLFLGAVVKRMRCSFCFLPALVNVTTYIITAWNQRAREWRSGRSTENQQGFCVLENFTPYSSKHKFNSSLLCGKFLRNGIEKGNLFGGLWEGWWGGIDGMLNSNSWLHN